MFWFMVASHQWLSATPGLDTLSPCKSPFLTQAGGLARTRVPRACRVPQAYMPSLFNPSGQVGLLGTLFSVRRALAWGVRWQLQADCISHGSWVGSRSEGILRGPWHTWHLSLGRRALDKEESPTRHRGRSWKGEVSQIPCRTLRVGLYAKKGPHVTEAP